MAGTTRDAIEVPVSLEGVPFVLVDTAGLRETEDLVEQIGVTRAGLQARVADILLWLGDESAPAHRGLVRLHARADQLDRREGPVASLAVSAVTGEGLSELKQELVARARSLLPARDSVALNRRQAAALEDAAAGLELSAFSDIVITAESLRVARSAMERVTGRAGVEDVLDALFGRFCLGK